MNKQTAVAAALQARAAELGPGGKLPTFRELQKELGVSRTTLSSVLDALESRGVLSRKHGVGIFASPQLNHRSVALLADPVYFQPGEADPFWPLLVREAQARAGQGDESLTVQFIGPESGESLRIPSTLVASLEQGKVDGIIGVGLHGREARWIQDRRIPFSAYAGMGRCTAEFDKAALTAMLVEELARRGCRRIELWGEAHKEEEVAQTFNARMEELGLPPGRIRLARIDRSAGADLSQPPAIPLGAAFAEEALAGVLPDGIAFTDDTVCRGALTAFMRHGLMAGRDFTAATHCNRGSSLLAGLEDMLVRVECDPSLLVKELFRMLEVQMSVSRGHTEKVVLKPSPVPSP